MRFNRRSFLAAASLASASLAAAPIPAYARGLSAGAFTHGVASGDPLPDRVMLWTRFVHSNEGRIGWEVSESEDFAAPVARGETQARFADDFCVKIDARGLRPGRRYFYRFLAGSGPSPTGLTRTAPESGVESLNIALFSCSNFPYGYFHAYGHAAARADIDIAVHVGDYIYEMGRGTYPSEAEAVPGRIIDPARELVSLSDYYQRYATYHSDPDLLELRRVKPLCAVWDDHELVNDTWREGAKDHNPDYEGAFSARMAAATKAYFDWMPLRRPDPRAPRLYRALDWGDLARIVLLDTRLIGRDRQVAPPRELFFARQINSFQVEFHRELYAAERSMLGAAQEAWLSETLAGSKARGQTWQVLAQQVVMGEQIAPDTLTNFLPPGLHPNARRWYEAGEALGRLGLPWNYDSWGGYPAARQRLLDACVAHAANALVLAGDSHNCWINNHPGEGRMAAIEFAGGSVTSPGFERALSNAGPGEREAAMRGANPNIAWCDLTRRGYGGLRLTRGACEAEWIAFDSVREPHAPPARITRFTAQSSAAAGPSGWSISG